MVFRNNVQHVRSGEPGRASVPGRPDRQLEENIKHLKTRQDTELTGSRIIMWDQTLDPDAMVGQPVFWNESSQRFEQALAGVDEDPETGTLIASDSSHSVGIIINKSTTSLGDILVAGVDTVDLSNAVDGTISQGRYYLSAATPGKLTRQRPPVTIFVLHAFGDGRVLVVPDVKDFLQDHIHHSFELEAVPAGEHTPPLSGDNHEIVNPDSSLSGWLPANDAIFEGNAPAGAKFGYNLSQHDSLNRVWPPVPVNAARITWDKALNDIGGTDVPRGENGLVVMDRKGIWWMSNCYGLVPWPTDLDTGNSSESSLPSCPYPEDMRMTLDFIRMTFNTATSVVTKLESLNELLVIEDCDGDPASTGDLKIRLNLDFLITDTVRAGYNAVKFFDEENNRFETGPVVEGIIAGDNVDISSSFSQVVDGDTQHHGIINLSVDTNPLGRELPVELFRLDDTRMRFNGIVPYLAFVTGQANGYVGKIHIPPTGLPADPHVKLRLVLLLDQAGTPPDLTLNIMRVARPTVATALPSTQTLVTFDPTAIGGITANQYFEVESDSIEVAAGDTLYFEFERAAGDGFAGELGMLRTGAVIQSGA